MMAVAGLDSYLHWLVYRRVSEVRVQGELPKSFRKLEIPFFAYSGHRERSVRFIVNGSGRSEATLVVVC